MGSNTSWHELGVNSHAYLYPDTFSLNLKVSLSFGKYAIDTLDSPASALLGLSSEVNV